MRARLFGLWWFLVLLLGCADPYVWRHPRKNGHDLAVEKEQCEITAAEAYPPIQIVVAMTPGYTTRCYPLGNGARNCGSEYESYYLPSPIYLGDGSATPYLYPFLPCHLIVHRCICHRHTRLMAM